MFKSSYSPVSRLPGGRDAEKSPMHAHGPGGSGHMRGVALVAQGPKSTFRALLELQVRTLAVGTRRAQ